MKRYTVSAMVILAVGAAFWAYAICDSLIREFHKDVTVIDLGSIFILGFISGIAVGLILSQVRKSPQAG